MAKPVTIPNTLAGVTTSIPLSNLDSNWTTLSTAMNDYNTYGNYLVDSGSANSYVVTYPASMSGALTAGLIIQFKATNANTTTSTLNPNSLGAKTIVNPDGSNLSAGQIKAGAIVTVQYDGTNFQLQGGGAKPFAPTTGSAIQKADGSGGLTAATAGTDYTSPSDTETMTNKRVTPRVGSTTSSATPTINTDNYDIYQLTAQAADITSFTTNLSGTPTEGQPLIIEITGTAARAITWGTSFESSTVTLPTTTVTTNKLTVAFMWNGVTSKWRCVGKA